MAEAGAAVVNADDSEYDVDPGAWTCTRPAFKRDRFLLCKHLVHAVQPIHKLSTFFREVRRSHSVPFYEHRDLKPSGASEIVEENDIESIATVSVDSSFEEQFIDEPEDDLVISEGDEDQLETRASERDKALAILDKAKNVILQQDQVGGDGRFGQVLNSELRGDVL